MQLWMLYGSEKSLMWLLNNIRSAILKSIIGDGTIMLKKLKREWRACRLKNGQSYKQI